VDEKVIEKRAFDLILSFDDVVSHGYRESVTMAQLEAYLEMDSADEKVHKKMQLIREAEAKEIMKKQQREISKRKHDPNYQPDASKSASSEDYAAKAAASTAAAPSSVPMTLLNEPEPTAPTRRAPGKGMQLGKPKKQNELMKDLQKEKLFSYPSDSATQ